MPIATPAPQQQVDCDKCDAGYVMDYTIGNIFEAHPSGAKCTKCLSSDCSKCNRLIAEGRFWVKNCQGIDYDIYVPKGCLSKKCGLIFDIHGMSMDANEQKQSSGIIKAVQKYVKSGMAKMAGVSDFIVVNPEKPADYVCYMPFKMKGKCDSTFLTKKWCGMSKCQCREMNRRSWKPKVNHDNIVRFMRLMAETYKVDRSHVHVSGFSQGSFASFNTLCMAPDLICSIAPVGAPPFGYRLSKQPDKSKRKKAEDIALNPPSWSNWDKRLQWYNTLKDTRGNNMGCDPHTMGFGNFQDTCFSKRTYPSCAPKRSIFLQYGVFDPTCKMDQFTQCISKRKKNLFDDATELLANFGKCKKARSAAQMKFENQTDCILEHAAGGSVVRLAEDYILAAVSVSPHLFPQPFCVSR